MSPYGAMDVQQVVVNGYSQGYAVGWVKKTPLQ